MAHSAADPLFRAVRAPADETLRGDVILTTEGRRRRRGGLRDGGSKVRGRVAPGASIR